MAAPTTPILDSFIRADENPATGWVDAPDNLTYGGVQILSNQLASRTSDSWDYFAAAGAVGPNADVYATLSVLPAAPNGTELWMALNPLGSATINGYALYADTSEIRIVRGLGGVQNTLQSFARTVSSGDSVWLNRSGATLTAYHKVGGGSWDVVGSVLDSSFTAVGRLAVYLANTTARITAFGGGTVTEAAGLEAPYVLNRRRRT